MPMPRQRRYETREGFVCFLCDARDALAPRGLFVAGRRAECAEETCRVEDAVSNGLTRSDKVDAAAFRGVTRAA